MRHALPLRSALAATALIPVTALAQTECEPQRLLPIPGGTIGDFGSAIAMNDRHLIVGDRHDSRYCTVEPDCSNGMVYAYQKDAQDQWVLVQEIEPADLGLRFAFGAAVALSGDWMVATAAGDFAGGTNGSAYFFEFDGEQWHERQSVPNPHPDACADCFGGAAAMHGDMALIQGGRGPTGGGGVAVYQFNGDSWELRQIAESVDAARFAAGFGYSIAIDDDRVVIGATLERSIVTNGGAAYVFRREPDGTLSFEQKLIAPDVLEGPRFGSAVAISGGTLLIGAELSDRAHAAQGAVYAYQWEVGSWQLSQEFTHQDADTAARFGGSLALDGDWLAVGAKGDRTPMAIGPSGTAYLFGRDAYQRWRPSVELPPAEFDASLLEYGDAVAMSRGAFAVGASDTIVDGAKRGAVHAFDLSCFDCLPDLDADGALTVFDFLTFLNLFQDADPLADFDGDGEFTIFDFLAFQTAFDAGCA